MVPSPRQLKVKVPQPEPHEEGLEEAPRVVIGDFEVLNVKPSTREFASSLDGGQKDGQEELPTVPQQNPSCECVKCFLLLLVSGYLMIAAVAYTLYARLQVFEAPTCAEVDPSSWDRPRCCEPCGTGTWVLPLGGEMENSWPYAWRAVMYFLLLMWCFLGVAIVCDHFMGAIEEITKGTRVVWVKGPGGSRHKFHVPIWNETIANLSLMALGSSAPEIMLSIVEITANRFFAGELGPSTIVGSAAFNLLLITAVCISAIPAPEIRRIEQVDVFMVTSVSSILAYFWLLLVLKVHTPDKVDLWEAIVTLAFFPLLLIVAYAADKKLLRKKSGVIAKEAMEEASDRLTSKFGKMISQSNIKQLIEAGGDSTSLRSMNDPNTGSLQSAQLAKRPSMAQYRQGVTRNLTGSGRGMLMRLLSGQDCDSMSPQYGFTERRHVVLECAGVVQLQIVATRPLETKVRMRYCTYPGTAKAGVRYEHTEGEVVFNPHVMEQVIEVPIIDNDTWEPVESFMVELFDLEVTDEEALLRRQSTGSTGSTARPHFKLPRTTVVILNDDEPGTLSFRTEEITADKDTLNIVIEVKRTDGATGDISCHYETHDGRAIRGYDYEHTEGELCFTEGEVIKHIAIPLCPRTPHSEDRHFSLVLNGASEGVKFDPETNGGDHSAICDVILAGEPRPMHKLRRFFAATLNRRRCLLGLSEWREQINAALYCGGSAEEQANATTGDWVFHALSLFWKLVFSLVPPLTFCGGWACFLACLVMIALLTVLIGDLASLLGCCLRVIPDDITAITFVALGTSLPDTFASKTAAENDTTADNSVGNVTGSNSVNVFLGLGIPWTMGALYWKYWNNERRTQEWNTHYHRGRNYKEVWGGKYPGGGLLVPADSLAFSVGIFTVTACIAILLLVVRRYRYGGELGGPKAAQRRDSAILVGLWLAYVGASVAQSISEGQHA